MIANGKHLPGRARTDLLGRVVLLIEDDFCQARDTQQALQHAGARVIGPFGDSQSALRSIASKSPSCAIVDIGLRDGVCFGVAAALQDEGVPFVFVTGHDESVIPADFASVPVLRKPVDIRSLLKLTASLSGDRWGC